MRKIALIIILCFLSSCATTYTDVGLKKKSFTPNFDPDCKRDDSTVSGLAAVGVVCAHDNGIIFIKSTFSSFTMSGQQMQNRAQKFCDVYHEGKKAVNKGKPNVKVWNKLDWGGVEFICV